ncbi:MAG: ribonuclease III [Myxococcota bacterium]
MESQDSLASLEAALGHTFRDRSLLVSALTHRSFANVARQAGEVCADNQRLEFLGDAVLDLVAAEALFSAAPEAHEGQLTQRRAALVHEARMAEAALVLDLGAHLRVGPGAQCAALRARASVLADTFEAVVAALYLDAGGLDVVRRLFARLYPADLATPRAHMPAKARLQELAQSRWKLTPVYTAGPAPSGGFEAVLTIGQELTATGRGTSKRAAEEHAAGVALQHISTEATRTDPR